VRARIRHLRFSGWTKTWFDIFETIKPLHPHGTRDSYANKYSRWILPRGATGKGRHTWSSLRVGRACTFNSVQHWLPFCLPSLGCPLHDSKGARRSPAGKYPVGSATCFVDNYRKGAVERAKVGRNFGGRKTCRRNFEGARGPKNDAADAARLGQAKGNLIM